MVLLLAPPFRRSVDKIGPGVQVHGRYADLREAELIRAIEVPLVGKLIGLDDTALLTGDQRCDLIDRRFAEADEGYIVGVAPDVAAIVVQVRRNPAGWKRGVGGIKFRP